MINAVAKLEGLAKVWYDSLPTIDYTWKQWKEKFLKAFPPKRDFFNDLQHMMHRTKKANESYIVYYYEKIALLNQCNITGSNAVSCIIGGIPDNTIQTAAKSKEYPNPEMLLCFLKSCDVDSNNGNISRSTKPNNKRFRENYDTHNSFKNRRRIVCFACKKEGHKASQCRITSCAKCKRFGHRAEECRAFIKSKHNQPNVQTEKVL